LAGAMNVLIVGAGIVGQTLACALTKRGIDCEIVEIKDDFKIAGAGMTLQGTALRAFLDIGIVDDMVAAGWHNPEQGIIFLDTVGSVVLERPEINIVGDGYPPSIAIRRQSVHEVLSRHVAKAGVAIHMGVTVETMTDTGGGAEVTFTDGRSASYALVVGCDGVRSKIRAMTFPGAEPDFAGFCNWRLILPRPKSIDRVYWLWGHGKTIGLIPVSDDQIYVAGVGKVANTDRPDQETVPATFRDKFACFGGLVPEILKLDINVGNILYTVVEQIKLPAPWFKGRIMVIGDAAHAACPFWAQGAAVGIEDAIVLAQELQSRDDIDASLAAWFERRFERAKFIQDGSFETGQNLTRDVESDAPKIFPPPVIENLAKQGAAIQARLAEPY